MRQHGWTSKTLNNIKETGHILYDSINVEWMSRRGKSIETDWLVAIRAAVPRGVIRMTANGYEFLLELIKMFWNEIVVKHNLVGILKAKFYTLKDTFYGIWVMTKRKNQSILLSRVVVTGDGGGQRLEEGIRGLWSAGPLPFLELDIGYTAQFTLSLNWELKYTCLGAYCS